MSMASTTVDPTAVVLEVLNQFSNYRRWSLAVKNYLLAEDLWDVVEDDTKPSEESDYEYKTWRKKNAKALRTIQNCCGAYNSNYISEVTSAKDAWDILAEMFEPVFLETTEEGSSDSVTNGDIGHLSDMEELGLDANTELEDNEDTAYDDNGPDMMDFVRAVIDNDIQMAIDMVEKNKTLLTIGCLHDDSLPVLWAYATDQWEMSRYFYKHTPLKALKSRSGAELISQSFTKMEVDIAWDLIHRCPSLTVATDYFGHSPLNALAGMRCAFLSGRPIRFWEQWIYDGIRIEPTLTYSGNIHPPIQIKVQMVENNEENQRNINHTAFANIFGSMYNAGMGSLRQLASTLLKLLIPGLYNRTYQMKLIHHQNLAFLQFMCEVTKTIHEEKQLRFVQSAIFKAVERGHIEFITHILKVNPSCAMMTDAKGMNMFQFAIECRQEKIYSLIYGLNKEDRKKLMGVSFDGLNNTLLHLVGRLPPHGELDHIQDAALRMQREVQWFKEVECILPKSCHDIMNFTDNMTAHELFTKNHKQLKHEGEKSMKGTATSCTVVAALIVTIMFAAAFTVPGGNSGETGIPVLVHQKWFMVFLVADALSLCFSTTSVIIFLGILTSRYAEVDFLTSLPTKMIFGLLTLFLAITTMMVAFTSAIYIVLERKSGTGIPITLLGAVPVTTFVVMQFRLLKEMVISTYGVGLFQREVKDWRLN